MNDEIDSNKVVAVDEKVKHFAPYAKKFLEDAKTWGPSSSVAQTAFRMWQKKNGGDIAEFLLSVQQRLVMGSLKYGDTWKYVDLEKEMYDELLDIVCYDYLMELRKKLGHWSQRRIAEEAGKQQKP